jgi:UTP--glucose-1-phosphate uridylyltransferase
MSIHSGRHPVRTAIFPVAGLGTRFLPATKALPKELLPVLDTPLIQFAIDEARAAGIERMVFVTHPSKDAIRRHVLDDKALRSHLEARGKHRLAKDLHEAALNPANHDVAFPVQEHQLGLGHAVLLAKPHVLPGAVAVILPDDLILGAPGALSEMIASYSGGHMIATMDVPDAVIHKYGVLDTTQRHGPMLRARGLVEKPAAADAPSNSAVVGRYVLDASIFDDLARQAPGAKGEIQLTDAIDAAAGRVGLTGFVFSGRRFDCGMPDGMLAAQIFLAGQRDDLVDVVAPLAPPIAAE